MSQRNVFYKRVVVPANTEFTDEATLDFGFQSSRVMIAVFKSTQIVHFSFLQPHLDGELFCTDGPITFDALGAGRIWLYSEEECEVRVWAWRN